MLESFDAVMPVAAQHRLSFKHDRRISEKLTAMNRVKNKFRSKCYIVVFQTRKNSFLLDLN
jgi:hypothetical protein